MKKPFLLIIIFFSIASLSVADYPPPEKGDIDLRELQKQIFDFDGKVVEIELTGASGIKKTGRDKYSVSVRFTNRQDHEYTDATIYFIKDEDGDALEFFEKLAELSWGGTRQSVYVLVEGKTLTAIGEKYRKSKGTYRW